MNYNSISPSLIKGLEEFASINTKFRLFLNDINLKNYSKIKLEEIFEVLSNAFLEPELTLHIVDIFKNDVLKILSLGVHKETNFWVYENHVKICLALSKALNIHPDVGNLVMDYFEKFPAPFAQPNRENRPHLKKSKLIVNDEIVISDIEIVTMSYIFLKFSPNYFRNKWSWNEFIDKYISHKDTMVKWICCHIIGILTAMNAHKLFTFIHTILTEKEVHDCSLNFEMNSCKTIIKDVSSVNISVNRRDKLSTTDNSIVEIGGINLPLHNVNTKLRVKIVEVKSTKDNLKNIAIGILSNKAINLLGPVGSGKSVLIEYIAEKTGRILGEDFIKVQLGDQTDSKMLLGTYRCTDIPGEFVWQPGVLTQAVMNGSWLLLEDIDSASTDIASVLCGLLENKHLTVPGYRDSVPIKPGFRLFVTQRLIPTITGYYKRRSHGCEILEKHLLNINIDSLSKNELKEIIKSLFPSLATITSRIVSVFEIFTKTIDENGHMHKNERLVSTRDLFKWCSRAVVDYDVSSTTSGLKILQDAIDIFCSSQRDRENRLNLAKEISSHLGIVNENAVYFCTQYKPNMSLNANSLKAGRATLTRSHNIFEKNVKFCFTRFSACLLESIMSCVITNEPVLLVGETGTGKTSTVQFLARTLGQELIVINMNQQSDSADLLGGYKPVDLKFIVGPVKREFEQIFYSYFNVEQNKKFLGHIAFCFNSQMYNELILLMKRSYGAAMKRLTNQIEEVSITGKKRKKNKPIDTDTKRHDQFLESWSEFGKKLAKLELQLKHKNALAFSFIEGSLVKAVEKGHWVLLDEINLANAETLECLSSLLEGPHGSINLLERGDKRPIKRHPNFTLFACMNPSTDVGKRDLPAGLRNRFTEFFVDELTDKNDLLLLANSYLEAKSLKVDKVENLVKFYLKVRAEAQLNLSDGLGQKPHFSLRSFCRALYIASKNPCGNITRSLYEAFCLSFLTQLDLNSYGLVEKMIITYVIGSRQDFKAIIKHNIPKPHGSNDEYLQIEGYWVPLGSLEPTTPENYILTHSVRKNLKDLVRIVSIGQLPVLLQGDTSVGKTSLITYLAKSSGHKCVRINNHEHTDLQEYVGSYVADVNGKLVFREGLLVEAMRKGHWIILDELNLAPSDVLEALNRVLDDNRELFIPETQEVVKAHPNFMLFATQNPPGSYGGRKMLSRAFRNRFVELHFNEIPLDELEIILHQRCQMAPSYSKKMISVMKELQMRRRGSAAFAGKHGFITLRDLFRWGERYRLAEDKATLYDWDQHIADEGYLLLAGKVRKEDEKVEIADVIKKIMKRDIDPKNLFTLSEKTSPVTKLILEKIEKNKHRYSNIVWTFNMRQLAVLVSKALEFYEPVLLIGETGCGKTTICDLLAQNNDQKLITVNCHMHTESGDFIGGLRPFRDHSDENKLFEWVDGPLITAMIEGNVFLIDEISLADDSVLERLNSLLEPERTLLLAEKGIDINNTDNSELVVANKDFHFIGTMNPGGDFGKKELSPALRNRFTEIWCEPCNNRKDLISIINHNVNTDSKTCSADFGELIMDFIEWFKQEEIGKRFTISIRDILTWVNFINVCFTDIKLGDLYINGAYLTFLDSFGSGITSSESDDFLMAFKGKCLQIIKEQCEKNNLHSDTLSGNTLKVEKKGQMFGIHPFYIESGVNEPENISFTFDVPTIKQNTLKLLRGLQLKKAILLEGSPGVGKTSLVTALAKRTNNKIFRVNLSDQTDISDLFGADLPVEGGKSGQFAWRDGPLLRALKNGHWILLDELNLASQSVLEGLNACLDHRGEIFIPELGKTFYVKRGTKFFACQNPLKQGGSRRGLPKSFLNRFTQVYISPLSEEDYLCILKEQFPQIPADILQKMVYFNEELTRQIKSHSFGNKGGPWEYNLRDLTRWCEVTLYRYANNIKEDKQFTPESSINLIYSDRLRTSSDKLIVQEIFEDVFKRKISGESVTVYVTNEDVYFGDVCLKREIDKCNVNVQKDEDTCLVLRNQLKILRSLSYCLNMKWMSILVGGTGSGKTSVVRTLAHLAGKTLYTLPVTSAMDTSDLLGGFEQTDYTRHLDDIVKETELLLLETIQNLLLYNDKNRAVNVLKQWRHYSAFLTEVNKNRMMTEETESFIKKLENLSTIWRTLRDNETTSNDIEQTVLKLEEKGRVLLDAVKKEGTLNAGGKFEWVDSVLIKCLQNGHWLLIDNVNLCSPAVLDRLNALLEPNGTLTISERGVDENGKMIEIKPHENFRLFLTMDPKNGEISRAMRNRGVEIYLTNNYQHGKNFDVKSLANIKGVSDNTIIELLINIHNFISELVIGDEPNIDCILQSAFLISQQIRRGIDRENAIVSAIVDVYYKSRSDFDFNSSDPLCVIENEIKQKLKKILNKKNNIDEYDASITLISQELNSNTDLTRVKQQIVPLKRYLETFPEAHDINAYYFIMHFYSISSSNDLKLRHVFLDKLIAANNYSIPLQNVNNLLYKLCSQLPPGNVDLPMDRKWLPDTNYTNINLSFGNRVFLMLYFLLHKHANNVEIQNIPKENYTLIKYSENVKIGQIQDSIDDAVLREAPTLLNVYDKFILNAFTNTNTNISSDQTINVISFLQWRFYLNHILCTNVSELKTLELKEIISNLHVHYKWFLKYAVDKIQSLLNVAQNENLSSIISLINSGLTHCFSPLAKLGKRFRKESFRPPPLTNTTQLSIIPEYHKIIDSFDLTKTENVSRVLTKLSDETFASILLKLKIDLNYDIEEIPDNFPQLKQMLERFFIESDNEEYKKSDVNYLVVADYFSLITMYQSRLSNFDNVHNAVSVPCVLQGVLKRYEITQDSRLLHEIVSRITHYLLNNPCTTPSKYLKYKSDENVNEATLNWQNPILTFLFTSVLVNTNNKTLNLKVDLKDYYNSMKLYDKFNHLLWKNTYQLSDSNCAIVNLDKNYIMKKFETFIYNLAKSLNIDREHENPFEIMKLCLERIQIIEKESKEEKNIWCSFLSECYKNISKMDSSTPTSNINLIANSYITLNYLNGLLNSKLSLIDPYTKIALKKKHIASEIENFEALSASFKIQNEVYSNVEFPLCPLINTQVNEQREKINELRKEIAVRPQLPKYESLLQDVNHAFSTVLSPNKINELYTDLESAIESVEKNDQATLNKANLDNSFTRTNQTIASIENFIKILDNYRYQYPDIIEPLYCNIMELLYGFKLKSSLFKKLLLQQKYLENNISIQNVLVNLVKFPYLDENQASIENVVDNYMGDGMQNIITTEISLEDPAIKHQKLNLLKCAIQETFNSCSTNAKYSQISDPELFDRFNGIIKHLIDIWNKQEEQLKKEQAEKESLYKMRSKCNDKSEDEQIEEELNNLFPNYFDEFSDMQNEELKDDEINEFSEKDFSTINLDDINFVYNLHSVFVCSHAKSPWLNLNQKHSFFNYIIPLMQKFKLLKLLLPNSINALNYDMDANILGGLHVLVGVAQKYGNLKLFDESGSPTRSISRKSFDFYRDSNIDEIKPSYQILHDIADRIKHLLMEWPDHPTLKNINIVIDRIYNFDMASPISRFLTGFEILLTKCHEWEENAHSGVSLQNYIQNITAQIITWRKIELNMWRDILNITFNRLNEPVGKWWCYIYQILEQFANQTVTSDELISTLTKFITESNLVEFEKRLELLFVFHCHCVYMKNYPELQILMNVLWNIYHYYKQFLPKITEKIKALRTPIEKKLKDYVKIVTWKDISYWSIKETLQKTHKTIHKHIREFEKVLRQPVSNFLYDIKEENTTFENIGIWDRPQRVSPKSYHYTMDSVTYIAKMSPNKKLTEEAASDHLFIKTAKYFKKSQFLCKEIISAAPYPKLVKTLDTFITEVIESNTHLQQLQIDTTLPKSKQKSQAKSILQQKHRSLSDLFKTLIKMGISFKKGILESKLDGGNNNFIMEPIDLEALFEHLTYKRNDEKLLTMWDGCELYFLKSFMRLNMLETALQNPSKHLGPQNIERCKGFAANLMTLTIEQKNRLVKSTRTFYYLRYYLAYFTDFCNETNFIHKDVVNNLKHILHNLIIVLEQCKILLQTCPEEIHDENTLRDIPTLKPEQMNMCYKYDPTWNKATTILGHLSHNAEKVLTILKKNKNIIPGSEQNFVCPTYVPVPDFELIMQELESVTVKLNDLSTLLGTIPLYSSLKWILKEIEDVKNNFSFAETSNLDVDVYVGNVINSNEKLLAKILISLQNVYKKYKNISENLQNVKTTDSEEDNEAAISDEHLKKLIIEDLFDNLSRLEIEDILKCITYIAKNIDNLRPCHYSKIKNNISRNLELFKQLILLLEYFVTQQVSAYRVTGKLTSVLLSIFIELTTKGFCIPPEFSEELSGEGQSQQSGGMGLGDGEGEKDVSDRIESEDQLEDANEEGKPEKNEENKDCEEEEKAIEMSEDFDSKLHDANVNSDNENESSHSDAEEQMGDTEKGTNEVDQQIWGSDEEVDEEEDDKTNEEKGESGEQEGEQKMTAKETSSKENEESPDPQDETENKKPTNQINEEDPEYDDDQIDPYHGKQPELPEPEPMDLPDNLELDENEKTTEENEDENPFDVDAMKEQIPPETNVDAEEEKDNEIKEDLKENMSDESDDDISENKNQEDLMETDKDDDNKQTENNELKDNIDEDNQEDLKESEQSTLDQTSTDTNQIQPMDVDHNASADKVVASQAKNEISNESNPISQEDAPDKDGVGQSQVEESSTGHKGAANAQQDTQDSNQNNDVQQAKRQKPGESDSQRSLGDTSEPVKKKLKTIHIDDNKETNEKETQKSDADIYQHIKEAKSHTEQVLDAATKEQVEQQKEIPSLSDEECEKPDESSEELPETLEEDSSVKEGIKQKAEKLDSENKDLSNKSQHPEGDIINDQNEMEIEVEGEIVQTSTVLRGQESAYHTQYNKLLNEAIIKLSAEDMNNIRVQVEEQLSKWTEAPTTEEAQKSWEKISAITSSLARDLSEQLRLVLEPTQASRLRGDFKTGKRINMRKIIPYIASQFRKDKIWLRRTKPAKRDYQIVLAIDDSSSMKDNHSKELAFESVALISKALTLLESGQLSVLSFGESTELLHKLDETFTDKSGYKLLQNFQFDQKKTCVGQMVNFATEMLNTAHTQSNALNAKLLVIISDGRGIYSEGETYIHQALRRAKLSNIFTIFIIIDNPQNNSSILDIRTPVFNKNVTEVLSIKAYMDSFPFPFYIILRDINSLPNVLSDALRQWFEIVSSNDRT